MMVLHALGPQLQAVGLGQHVLIGCAVLTMASLGVASLSWIALEKPFIAWGRRFTNPEVLRCDLRNWFARPFSRQGELR